MQPKAGQAKWLRYTARFLFHQINSVWCFLLMPLTALLSLTSANPNLTQEFSSPDLPPPLASPLLTSSLANCPRSSQPKRTLPTVACCPPPATRCPPEVPTHTRLIAPASAFSPTPGHQPKLQLCGAQQEQTRSFSTSAPPAQRASAPSTQRPIRRPQPANQQAGKQASGHTVTQSNLPVCSLVRLPVCSSLREGRFTDLLCSPHRPADLPTG